MKPLQQMLSVAEARARILDHFLPLDTETIAIAQAAGRVLAEEVIAPHDLPLFSNSSMDGYAVRVRDVAAASRDHPVSLRVSGDIPAGAGLPAALADSSAARIMTGAPVPAGADAVVPVEDTDDGWADAHPSPRQHGTGAPPPAHVRIYRAAAPGAHIRPVGQDMRAGQVVLQAGVPLGPAGIGVLAALGLARVRVYRQPLVAVFSTGDELCEVDQTPAPGLVHDVNSYALAAAVARYGGRALRLDIARDRAEAVGARLLEARERGAHVILSSAGVSVGAYDVVKAAVEAEGALDFWRVRMRPGKPLAFGSAGGVPFFGLPGNPVSALVGFEVFVRPVVLKLGGHRHWEKPQVRATLLESIRSDGRESYVRVTLEPCDGGYTARSTGDQGSAVLTSLVRANGLLIIPEGAMEAHAGEVYSAWLLEADAGVSALPA